LRTAYIADIAAFRKGFLSVSYHAVFLLHTPAIQRNLVPLFTIVSVTRRLGGIYRPN